MARFLFTTWEGGGHVQPLLTVAAGLKARGHAVLIMSDACNRDEADALGEPFRPWRRAPSRTDRLPASDPLKDWLADSPLAVIEGLCRGIIAGPAEAYARDVIEAADVFSPDVLVTHELVFGAMVGAEALGLRLAVLSANVWSLPTPSAAPPFGGGLPPPQDDGVRDLYTRIVAATRSAFQVGLPTLNAAREAVALAPLGDLFDQLTWAGRILVATSRAFDFETQAPAPFVYVGPYIADPVWAEPWRSPWPADDRRPLVLVSFSSMYQAQEPVLRRVLEAIAPMPVRAILTLGPVLDPADFPAPDNVVAVRSAPHSQILEIAAAAVSHCGHGSTLGPLMAGVPLLCMPLGRDQPDNAVRVTERGAGLQVSKDAAPEDIRAALARVIDEPSFRRNAQALGRRVVADTKARNAEDVLEALAAEPLNGLPRRG